MAGLLDNDGRPGPEGASTAPEFVAALRRLRSWSGMGFRLLEKRAAQLGLVLPRSTITSVLNRDTLPRQHLVVALVLACGGDQYDVDRWIAVWRRVATSTPSPAAPAVPPSASADGWHTARFGVLVRLDTPSVETYQDWRIVADRDELDRITLGVTTPFTPTLSAPSAPGLAVEVRYGAKLLRHEQPSPYRSQFTLVLPRPLRAGQGHDCGIIVRLEPGRQMRPHYVLTGTRPCEQFTLRVRFHPDRLPVWVRRVCGEPVRSLDIVASGSEPLGLDAVGEIYTEFDRPTMYLAYGAQWKPAGEPAG